jgi:hypothetical protein
VNEGWRPRLGSADGVTTVCPSCLGTGLAVTHPPLVGASGTIVHLEGSVEVGPGDRQLGSLRERLIAKDEHLAGIIRDAYLSDRPQRPSLRYDQRQRVERELFELGAPGRLLSFDQRDVQIQSIRMLEEAGYVPADASEIAEEILAEALRLPRLVSISIWGCRCGRSSAASADGALGRADELELQPVSHVQPDADYANDTSLEPHWRDLGDGLAALGRAPGAPTVAWLQWLLDEFAETTSYRVELIDEPGSAWVRKLLESRAKSSILARAEEAAPKGMASTVAELQWWLRRGLRENTSQSIAALQADPSVLTRLDRWVGSGLLSETEASMVRAAVTSRWPP